MGLSVRSHKKIAKAVIPAAGFGTRMLPATKAVPKELLLRTVAAAMNKAPSDVAQASTEPEQQATQRAKLRLVIEVAEEVWGNT